MSPPLAARVSAAAVAAVVLGALASAVLGWQPGRTVSSAALVVYFALEARLLSRGGRMMLAASAAAAVVAVAFKADWPALLARALGEAAFLAGLFIALGALRDAAQSSALVQSCGALMVRQPPGRRYAVLCLGSHLISLVLNFGVLSLLGTMVQKGNTLEAAGGDPRIAAIRQQRMMTAVLRGFALMTVWSPLSVSFAVTQAVVHGLPWWRLLPLQMVLAALLLGLGWLLDRRAFPPVANLPGVGGPTDWRPLGRLVLLVAAVVVASVASAEAMGVRLVLGAMLVVPISAVVWLTAQHRSGLTATLHFAARFSESAPAFRNEAAMLGGAMFFGTVVSAFVSPEATAALIARLSLPPSVVAVLLAWSVMALAQVGLSQIVTVTLLGGALADLSALGIQPLVLASGLMGAWALSAVATPIGAAVLTVARISGVDNRTVTHTWNGRFIILGALLLAAWMLALSALI
ncbi:MAG: hypothetical protein ACM31L_13400 [Actinomycetota bacterium]